jgi:hypothetical protein
MDFTGTESWRERATVAGAIMGPGVAAKRMQFRKRVVKKASRFQVGHSYENQHSLFVRLILNGWDDVRLTRGSFGSEEEGWGMRIMFDFCSHCQLIMRGMRLKVTNVLFPLHA